MAASTLATCIRSALHSVDLLLDVMFPSSDQALQTFKSLRFQLRKLEMFALSARKLGNHPSLESFMAKIEDAVGRINVPNHSLEDLTDQSQMLSFHKDINSLEEQIHEWYNNLLDAERGSISLTKSEILEIISSFLESLEQYQSFLESDAAFEILENLLKACQVQISFLRNLILLATQRNVEPSEALLVHAETMAILASRLLAINIERVTENDFLSVLETTMPTDPHVYKAYTDALRSSKCTRNPLPTTVIFWEAFAVYTYVVIPMPGQLVELYEGLRSLMKMILKLRQPNKFDVKIKEDILTMLCDAGIFILSLYQEDVQLETELLKDLLKAVKIILVELEEKDPLVPTFNYRGITQFEFIGFLLQKLMELTSRDAEQTAKSCEQTIKKEVVDMRSFLVDILEMRHNQVEYQSLWDRVLEVAYKVEDFIDYLEVEDSPNYVSTSLDSIMKDIAYIKSIIQVIQRPEIKLKRQEIEVAEVSVNHNTLQSTSITSMEREVVGFQDQANSIIDRLKRGSNNLRIVAIVGMAGLGKTTLAGKVYNDDSVSYSIPVRAWTVVSQTVNKRKVFIDLLAQIDPKKCSEEINSLASTHDLAELLWRSLKGRKYLIVLDDVWDVAAWQSLQESFPDDFKGSRVMLTSRNHNVAPPSMLEGYPYEIQPLSKDESLDLMQRQLFGGNGWPTELYDIGRHISDICNGLPLTIVIEAMMSCYHSTSLVTYVGYAFTLLQTVSWSQKIYCSHVRSLSFKYPENRLLFRDISFMMLISKLLRVLDLEKVRLNWKIPSEIGLLVRLTYLAIGCSCYDIPPSIGNLFNLETLILKTYSGQDINIPDSFWNLRKLKHLYVRGEYASGGLLSVGNLDSSPVLYELDEITGLYVLFTLMERLMKRFPNVRRLKFGLLVRYTSGSNKIVVPSFLNQLESLHVSAKLQKHINSTMFEFSFPRNLKKVTLRNFSLSATSLFNLGKLPNLEVLKLEVVRFEGNTWRIDEEEEGELFCKLRILKLDSQDLQCWSTSSEDQFVSLEKLQLQSCLSLEEMPSCLESIPILQMIQVNSCSNNVEKFVKGIEEVQKGNGNSDLKVFIFPIFS
ncbi:OLC1v1013839C1 [Oldenlandia corymbosa var. corymbosa]|uniref:OLC1v1013839C1 n=1 Tax=Oldenlandia corymbosa var. corymbosa TaxID=529605 RepID=A0AAV1E1F4_OLDCO|nr:OLC1v1013839C1 [Oldenlandia corymbosa var. corymbosa]